MIPEPPPQQTEVAASRNAHSNGGSAPAATPEAAEAGWSLPRPPVKQRVAAGFRSLLDSAKKLAIGDSDAERKFPTASADKLFIRTNPAVDGEDCSHDCASCTVKYPKSFKIDESDVLYGHVKEWSTHVLVATGKSDWVRDVADEKGSVMQAIDKAEKPANGRLMLSASNIPTPHHTSDYSEPTTVLLLPAFVVVENVTPATVPTLLREYVSQSPTNTAPLGPVSLPKSVSSDHRGNRSGEETTLPEPAPATLKILTSRPFPHRVLVLLCSQKTRDARCGQSAPLIRKELERHLRPLGLYRDLDDERPGGVGIYFISHVGGHKYSANVMVYRRPDPFGLDGVERGKVSEEEVSALLEKSKANVKMNSLEGEGEKEGEENVDVGAGQCIWLARVTPQDCENLVRYTILQGKVVKPETQLRGGFDRQKGLLSW